jgi:hypothetical protein
MSLLGRASRGVARRCSAFTATPATASATRRFGGASGAAPDEIGLIAGGARSGPIRVPLVRGGHFIVCS